MAARGAAATQPSDESRPQLQLAADAEPSDAERLAADATSVERVDANGACLVPLVTANGKGEIRIPAPRKWRATAKNALFAQDNPLAWAAKTLSTEDFVTFAQLDPNEEELDVMWREWGRATGEAIADFLASRG